MVKLITKNKGEKMKSKILSLLTVGIIGFLLLGATSCKMSTDQIKEYVKIFGLGSATTWIAIDNPSPEVLKATTNIMLIVKEKAALVKIGETYVEVIYPELVKIIDKDVEPQYRPLCKAGAITLLGQLDLLFVTHPEWQWKEKQDLAIDITNYFIDGAVQGLSMAETSPVMEQARLNYSNRNNVVSKKK